MQIRIKTSLPEDTLPSLSRMLFNKYIICRELQHKQRVRREKPACTSRRALADALPGKCTQPSVDNEKGWGTGTPEVKTRTNTTSKPHREGRTASRGRVY